MLMTLRPSARQPAVGEQQRLHDAAPRRHADAPDPRPDQHRRQHPAEQVAAGAAGDREVEHLHGEDERGHQPGQRHLPVVERPRPPGAGRPPTPPTATTPAATDVRASMNPSGMCTGCDLSANGSCLQSNAAATPPLVASEGRLQGGGHHHAEHHRHADADAARPPPSSTSCGPTAAGSPPGAAPSCPGAAHRPRPPRHRRRRRPRRCRPSTRTCTSPPSTGRWTPSSTTASCTG